MLVSMPPVSETFIETKLLRALGIVVLNILLKVCNVNRLRRALCSSLER